MYHIRKQQIRFEGYLISGDMLVLSCFNRKENGSSAAIYFGVNIHLVLQFNTGHMSGSRGGGGGVGGLDPP